MNIQLTLLENIQASFLSSVKSKHAIVRKGLAMISGQEVDETAQPPQLISIDSSKVEEILSWVIFTCETNTIPDQLQDFAEHPHYSVIFLSLFTLFSEAIRCRVADKLFKETLHCFHLPSKYAELFISKFSDNFRQLTDQARSRCIANPSLESFDWRVDVIISTTALNKVFVPILLLQMTTTDGVIKTFECSLTQFHQLRYSVAKMLANMQTIDQHPTLMRLID
jgi:hypothetical protein